MERGSWSCSADHVVTIRPARPDDLPKLARLEQASAERFRASPHQYASELPTFDAEHLAALQAGGSVFVATDEHDEPIGMAIGGVLGGEAYLHELDVLEGHGRRGVGRALIGRVAEWARAAGHTTLALSTFSDVPWNAPYYARLGFEVVPLEAYGPEQRAQRAKDGAAGMRLESRVIMRASVERLTRGPPRLRRLPLVIMGLGLLLPFLDVEFKGCQKDVATPCEAPPVVQAAKELLLEWGTMNVLVKDIACPSYGEVEGTLLVPSYSRRTGTLCEDYEYWAGRERDQAGTFLRRELVGLYGTYDDGVGPTRRPRLTVTCTQTGARFACDIVADLLVDHPPYNPHELLRDHAASEAVRAELVPVATKRTHVDFALESQPAVTLAEPQPLGPLFALLVHTLPAPLAAVTGELTISDLVYLVCLALFCVLLGLIRLGRYPRVTLAVACVAALVGLLLVGLFAWSTLDSCGGYFAYAPERRLYGFFELFFSSAESGLLLFTAGGVAHVVSLCAPRRSGWPRRSRG